MGKTKLVSAKMGKQPVMGQKKTKEAIAKAANASKKGGKKKWSKGKVKDKLNKAADKAMRKDVTNMSLVTISTVCEKYKIIGSLARPMIKILAAEGKIVPVGNQHSTLVIYTGKGFLDKKATGA